MNEKSEAEPSFPACLNLVKEIKLFYERIWIRKILYMVSSNFQFFSFGKLGFELIATDS